MKSTGPYPSVRVDAAGAGVVSQAGGVLLLEALRVSGLDRALSAALLPWRKQWATHDPGKIVTDLAVTLALGGDCLADLALLRAEPGVFGLVASDPTVSRLFETLAADLPSALKAINAARARTRARVWQLAGPDAPDAGSTGDLPLRVDLDATLLDAHSDKEHAAGTFKRGFGFHPLCAFVDHGQDGTGEPLAMLLRPGNAGSNTATDHLTVLKQALPQLPGHQPGRRPGRKILIRIDGAGATHTLLNWITRQRLSYSIGFGLPDNISDLLTLIPDQVWAPAIDAEGQLRDGAWVAEVTDLLTLTGWPKGMRIIVRKERPHPGAQLRLTDVDGLRLTAFATNTTRGQLPDLELRHRRRARCEDRIRNAKDTGLRNLPLHTFAKNQLWCHLVMLASELIAWTQLLAFNTAPARRWEPKRLRLRLLSAAGRLAVSGRRATLHLAKTGTWSALLLTAINTLRALNSQPAAPT